MRPLHRPLAVITWAAALEAACLEDEVALIAAVSRAVASAVVAASTGRPAFGGPLRRVAASWAGHHPWQDPRLPVPSAVEAPSLARREALLCLLDLEVAFDHEGPRGSKPLTT